MRDVYVIGASMTPFGRYHEKSVKDQTREAVTGAIEDAGIAQADIDAAWFSNTTQSVLEGQYLVAGEIALRDMGFEGIPMTNVENACASASTAFNGAFTAIKAGLSEIALAVGVDKMYAEEKERSFTIFDGAWDVHEVEQTFANLAALGGGMEAPEGTVIPNAIRSPFMDVYAAFAKHHMRTFGSTQKQLAAVAAKNHKHSTLNPLSQYQADMSIEEILDARLISWPLTLPMCSPISDGGAAAILVSEDVLDRFPEARERAVKVHASVIGTGVSRTMDEVHKHLSHLAANRAYEMAGLGPEDMDVAEVHDATAMGEITQTECLGFCAFGQGGWLAEQGETALGGQIPVNPSGGLESKGHPIGATGLGQIYELVTQVRGEAGARQVDGARHAIAENGGGIYGIEESVACITILGRA